MAVVRVGPARVPSHESPEQAVALLQERGYDACEIDFEGGLSTGEPMVPPWTPSLLGTRGHAGGYAGHSPAPPTKAPPHRRGR